jgi:hypothetical protein
MHERTLITIKLIRNEGVIKSWSFIAVASVTSFSTFVEILDSFCFLFLLFYIYHWL